MVSRQKNINIKRGLKQMDHLAPFLFLLVVKGLSVSIKIAVSLGLFSDFKIGSSRLEVSRL